MAQCKECYWFSDITVKCCELEHEPAELYDDACPFFEAGDGEA